MNFVILIALLVGIASANPRKYRYVSTAQFEDEPFEMHPDDEVIQIKPMNSAENPEFSKDYWINQAKDFISEKLKIHQNKKKAKNVIFFVGDGMSFPTLSAARVIMGGEEKQLSFEKFPYTGSSITHCMDGSVPDSACTATAFMSGVKTNDALLGLNARAKLGNCEDSNIPDKRVESIVKWALDAGKVAGVVTTTRVTHATPAAAYAHMANRGWEDDSSVVNDGCDSNIVDDIAEQLIYGEVGPKLKVILGGGSRYFIDRNTTEHGSNGRRLDGKNLLNEWLAMKSSRVLVKNRRDLMSVNSSTVDQLMGIFSADHVPYHFEVERDNLYEEVPLLSDMTLKAIEVLSGNPEGYFLYVEGGRIDNSHHGTSPKPAIDEAVQFSIAIEAAMEKIDIEDTLVVVTADHGHVMTMGGYPARGADIYGYYGTAQDGLPYSILNYANGLGYVEHRNSSGRFDLRELDRSSWWYRVPATVYKITESHGGEDVGIWAVGPWAHLFSRTVEQSVIPHIMAYASCIGHGLKACD